MELKVRNVNEAVCEGLWALKTCGELEDSRNGPVLVFPEPVTTTYTYPTERVLFWAERDANPIFHLLESIWMFAGRNDVEFVKYYNSRMGQFSDDQKVLNGAYGHRWRRRFGSEQLPLIIEHLRRMPTSRRAVLTMWGVQEDLHQIDVSADVCCNTQVYFEIRHGSLNMTVLCRSNDMVWGAYGANAVHFSMLQEFVAQSVGVPVGVYRQYSHNLHLYTELYDFKKHLVVPPSPDAFDYYAQGVRPRSLMDDRNYLSFLRDCELFCNAPTNPRARYYHSFFDTVAVPMARVTESRKAGGTGKEHLSAIKAEDWRIATQQWIERRENAKKTN